MKRLLANGTKTVRIMRVGMLPVPTISVQENERDPSSEYLQIPVTEEYAKYLLTGRKILETSVLIRITTDESTQKRTIVLA